MRGKIPLIFPSLLQYEETSRVFQAIIQLLASCVDVPASEQARESEFHTLLFTLTLIEASLSSWYLTAMCAVAVSKPGCMCV